MITQARQQEIVRLAALSDAVDVHDLAELLKVSESTIRRDLQVLERSGALTRTYGGASVRRDAAAAARAPRHEDHWEESARYNLDAKRRVGEAAAALVGDGQTILLDIGTTTPYIAKYLHGRNVVVFTSNIAVFDELRHDPVVTLVLIGGTWRHNYRSLVGAMAETALDQVRVDTLFLSCTGVRSDGVMDNIAVEASVKKKMIAAADQIVLVAPAEKFPGRGSLLLCPLDAVGTVITTAGADQACLDLVKTTNGKVIIA